MTMMQTIFADARISSDEGAVLLQRARARLEETGQAASQEALSGELGRMIQAYEAAAPATPLDEIATARAIVAAFLAAPGATGEPVRVVFADGAGSGAPSTSSASIIDQRADEARLAFRAAADTLRQAAAELDPDTLLATTGDFTSSLRSDLSVNADRYAVEAGTEADSPPFATTTQALGSGAAPAGTPAGPADPAPGQPVAAYAETDTNVTFTVFSALVDDTVHRLEVPDGEQDAPQRVAYLTALADFTVAARQYVDAEALRGLRDNGESIRELQAMGILPAGPTPFAAGDAQLELAQYRDLLNPVLASLGNVTGAYDELLTLVATAAATAMSGVPAGNAGPARPPQSPAIPASPASPL